MTGIVFWNLVTTKPQLRMLGKLLETVREEPERFKDVNQDEVRDLLATVTNTYKAIQRQSA